MAPYVRQRSTYRYNPYSRRTVTTSTPVISTPISRPYGYARGYTSSYRRRSYGRYRSKWSTIDSRTNPVYPRPEVKNIDTQLGTVTSVAIPDSGFILGLNSIGQGTNESQRIGRSVAVKSVYYNYVLNFGTGEVPNVIRHMLVWDRQSNGATPAASDILSSTLTITSPLNLDNKQRFVVLADERLTLSPNGDQIRICTDTRIINQKSTYANENAVPPLSGGLFLLFFSDEATTSNQPTFYGTWRVRYMDN